MNRASAAWRVALASAVFSLSLVACAKSGSYVELAGQRYSVEVADNDAAREHGLMDRTEMAADHGMLFVFQDDAPRAFWMKNTKIPLDMLFFDADKRLLSVQRNAQPCTADPCPLYSSGAPARYVLELNGGQTGKLDLSPGDSIEIHQ